MPPDPAGAADTATPGFFANASHELRTPLNGVIGMLELLLDSGLDDNQRVLAATACRSAGHLLALIDELLDLSMLERGRLPLEPVATELRGLLESVLAEQAGVALQHGAELRPTWHVGTVTVECDPLRAHQLVGSLIRAAIRQHPRGAIDVQLTAAADADDNCRLTLTLNGTRKRLQADAECLSWRFASVLARLMQASIVIAPQPADQITLLVPLRVADGAAAGARVLFVDAHDAARDALQQAIRSQRLRADGYATAADALQALKQAAATSDPYRIAMFDRHMQGIDGELLAHAIRSDPTHRHTHLVLRDAAGPSAADRRLESPFAAVVDRAASAADIAAALLPLCGGAGTGAPPAVRDLDGYRVLVADDHAVNQQVAARMLAKFGCAVDVASDGLDAIAMHHGHPYDLILMDCQMPELDGRQATMRIRDAEHGRHTPVIGCTANLMPDERRACLEAGMDDFIAKPLRPQALRALLDKWLAPRAQPGPAQPADELDTVRDMFGADFAELATLFVTDSPKRIAAMRAAAETRDATLLAKTAHSFSGSTASIGAIGLSACCKQLENDARAGRMAGVEPALAGIEREYARIEAKIAAMLASGID